MQQERRRDPYPWTWEIPLAVTVVTLLVVVVGIQLSRSVANLVVGAGWTWPDANAGAFPSPIGTAFWTSLPGVLAGDSAAGLPSPMPTGLAGSGLVWASLALTELTMLTATLWGGVYVYQRWGPGRMRGMATAAEAEKILGVTRLRKVADIVRPDIYGKHASAPEPAQHAAGDPTEQHGPSLGRGLGPWLLDRRLSKEER